MSRNRIAVWSFALLSAGVGSADETPSCPADRPLADLRTVLAKAPSNESDARQSLTVEGPEVPVKADQPVQRLRVLIACERANVRESALCSESLVAQRADASKEAAAECKQLEDRIAGTEAGAIGSTAATLGLQPRTGGKEGASLRSLLVEQRRRYKFLKKWLKVLTPDRDRDRSVDQQSARDELEALRNVLYNVLEDQGLREDFGAELVQGLMLQNTGGEPGGGSDDSQPTFLRIRSRRFGRGYDQDHGAEYMFAVRLGRVPTLLLVEPAASPSPAAPAAPTPAGSAPATPAAEGAGGTDTTHEKALMYDVRFDFIRTLGASSELVFGATFGQTFLDSKTLVRKVSGQDTLFATLGSGPGTSAEFWTAGAGFRYFHRAVRDIRAEQPSIDPLLEVSVDFRHDARFKLDPASAGAVRFDHPERRLVFRLKLGGIPLVDTRNPGAKAVTIGLGIEHERGLSSRGVPSATRIFLAGDLSILKAFAGK